MSLGVLYDKKIHKSNLNKNCSNGNQSYLLLIGFSREYKLFIKSYIKIFKRMIAF